MLKPADELRDYEVKVGLVSVRVESTSTESAIEAARKKLSLELPRLWDVIEKQNFGVLGMVTAKGEARTVGIVYVLDDRRLYIGTWTSMWKVRYVEHNPHVSVTIPIHKRVPFMPWIKVPAAVATFQGEAKLHDLSEFPADVIAPLMKGLELSEEVRRETCIIRVTPHGHIVTYGIGVPLMKMRDPETAKGRVPV